MNNTTKLNKTTQKAESWIKSYFMSSCFSVLDFYKTCSSEKRQAEKDIKQKMIENNCHDYRILNGNCFYFTCGYMSKDDNILYIETACNTFEIDLR
jgi:hypothetical protein